MSKPPKSQDGRVVRGEKTDDRIVDAIVALVRAGNVEPTVQEVAHRARVGVRTVFRRFQDLETLYRAMGERVMTELLPLVAPIEPTGDLARDLHALVARRALVFEHLAPFRRAGRIVRHRSKFLRARDEAFTRALRDRLLAVLQPHALAHDAIEALDLLLSFEAWDRLRTEQGLEVAHAERVCIEAALAIAKKKR